MKNRFVNTRSLGKMIHFALRHSLPPFAHFKRLEKNAKILFSYHFFCAIKRSELKNNGLIASHCQAHKRKAITYFPTVNEVPVLVFFCSCFLIARRNNLAKNELNPVNCDRSYSFMQRNRAHRMEHISYLLESFLSRISIIMLWFEFGFHWDYFSLRLCRFVCFNIFFVIIK